MSTRSRAARRVAVSKDAFSPPIKLSLAQTLPANILIDIFYEVLRQIKAEEDGDTPDFMHGGTLLRWNSNEHLSSVVRGVCHGWEDSARHVQYRSIAVIGSPSASNFLRTVSTAPHLAHRVRNLVVGVGIGEFSSVLNDEVTRAAVLAVEVLRRCTNVTRLQIRPLPTAMPPALLEILPTLRLTSLVLTPRLDVPDCDWSKGTWHGTDLPLFVTPLLRDLELNFLDGESTPFAPLPAPTALALERAHIHADVPEPVLQTVLAHCRELYWLEYYSEQRIRFPHALLRPVAVTLRHLSFLTNPLLEGSPRTSEPPWNVFLPSCTVLEEVTVEASDVSVQSLRSLPASLRTLEIFALTDERAFVLSEELYEILRDTRVHFEGLERLTIHDGVDEWPEEDVARLEEICKGRGFEFRVEWDDGE